MTSPGKSFTYSDAQIFEFFNPLNLFSKKPGRQMLIFIIILKLFPKIWVNYYREISSSFYFPHLQFSCISTQFFPLTSISFLIWSIHLVLVLPPSCFPSIFVCSILLGIVSSYFVLSNIHKRIKVMVWYYVVKIHLWIVDSAYIVFLHSVAYKCQFWYHVVKSHLWCIDSVCTILSTSLTSNAIF